MKRGRGPKKNKGTRENYFPYWKGERGGERAFQSAHSGVKKAAAKIIYFFLHLAHHDDKLPFQSRAVCKQVEDDSAGKWSRANKEVEVMTFSKALLLLKCYRSILILTDCRVVKLELMTARSRKRLCLLFWSRQNRRGQQ